MACLSLLICINYQQLKWGDFRFFGKLAVVASSYHTLKWQQLASARQSCRCRYEWIFQFSTVPAALPAALRPAHHTCLNPEGIYVGHTGLWCAFRCFNYIITESNCLLCVCLLFVSKFTFLEGRGSALHFFSVSLSRYLSAMHMTNTCLTNTF